ncbi:MAG: hypothetical protein RIC55_26830 [Pirellulaceae bacterium]
MPRNFKLTWQAGSSGRPGRWRKKYRGKVYYFAGGRGKSDRDAYQAALTEWEDLKVRLDAEAPKQHRVAYERAIHEWDVVLTWCRANDEHQMADTAVAKLALLRKGLAAAKPRPVRREDTFDGQFDLEVRAPDLLRAYREIGAAVETAADRWEPSPEMPRSDVYMATRSQLAQLDLQGKPTPSEDRKIVLPPGSWDVVEPLQLEPEVTKEQAIAPQSCSLETSNPLHLEREVWRDRLEVMQRSTSSVDESMDAHAEHFLKEKRAAADAGEITQQRFYNLQSHLNHFADWFGRHAPVIEINGKTLSNYRIEILKEVEAGNWSSATAKDRLSSIKSFIRWLWHMEAIPSMPRNMDSRSSGLKIGTGMSKVVIFEKSEIKTLLREASERTTLFILLMLNCGMTQKDIADLDVSEIEWKACRITRKRSKTRHFESVPEVSYLLWPKTLRLLRKHRSAADHGPALVNASGSALLHVEVQDDGKLKKNDNIRNAFNRLRAKTGIDKPLKSLKKTSASLIRGSSRFASLEQLFLGHAPQRMSDKHYTVPPQTLLDEAISWLGVEFGVVTKPKTGAEGNSR